MADLKAKQIKFPLTGTNVVSSSAQIATNISGSFTAASSSFSTRVTTAESELTNTLISSSAQIASNISGSFTAPSASFSTRVTTAESELSNTLISSSAQIATDISGSFTAPSASFSTRVTTAETELGNTLFSGSAQVDHDATTNFVANEHIDHTSVSITAGAGLTGGGTIASTRDIAVGAGTGVTVNANDVAIGQAVATTSNVKFANITGSIISGSSLLGVVGTATQGTIDIHSLSGYVANENIDHTSVTITAGDGLSGGGTIASTRTLAVDSSVLRTTGDNIVSSSAQIASNISGSFVAPSASFSTRITTEEANVDTLQARDLIAGDGLTGGGTLASDRTFAVGAGTGITVNSNDVAIGQSVATTANVTFATITTTGNIEAQGDVIAQNYIVSSSVTHTTQSFSSGSTIFGDTPSDDTHQFTGSLLISGSSPTDITTTNSIFVGGNITGSIISGSSLLGVVGTATQGTIDHDALANFVADEHVAHGSVSVVAGDGLTGGGTIAANRTLNVVGGDGITANANDVAVTAAQTAITSLLNSSLTKIGTAASQEYIKFDTSNEVNTHINNTERLSVTAVGVEVAGHISASGNITGSVIEASGDVIAFGSSDRRLKDNIQPIQSPLEKMDKIGGYTFVWNNKQDTYKGKDVGVVAQEIEEVLPELVTTRGTGYKAVKYEKIVPLLIESIKENTKKIKELEKEINQINENCDCLNK